LWFAECRVANWLIGKKPIACQGEFQTIEVFPMLTIFIHIILLYLDIDRREEELLKGKLILKLKKGGPR